MLHNKERKGNFLSQHHFTGTNRYRNLSLINERGMFQTEMYMVDILGTQIQCFLQCTNTQLQVQHVSYIL